MKRIALPQGLETFEFGFQFVASWTSMISGVMWMGGLFREVTGPICATASAILAAELIISERFFK